MKQPNHKFEELVLLPSDEEIREYPGNGWKQGLRPVPGIGPLPPGSDQVQQPKAADVAEALNLELFKCAPSSEYIFVHRQASSCLVLCPEACLSADSAAV